MPNSLGAVLQAKKRSRIPDEVIEVFNELICANISNGSAVIMEDDVISLLEKRGFQRQTIFSKGWLKVESFYKKEGWSVTHDKSALNEGSSSKFTFKQER